MIYLMTAIGTLGERERFNAMIQQQRSYSRQEQIKNKTKPDLSNKVLLLKRKTLGSAQNFKKTDIWDQPDTGN